MSESLAAMIERVARAIASVENSACDYWADFSANEQLTFRAMAVAAIEAVPASADTHPTGGDSTEIEAPLVSGAVPLGDAADAQGPSQ